MAAVVKRTRRPSFHLIILSCLSLLFLCYYGLSLWSMRLLPKEPSILLKATLTAPDHSPLASRLTNSFSKNGSKLTAGNPQYLWLSETKVILFLNYSVQGGRFVQPALYDLSSRECTSLYDLGKNAVNAETVLPSPNGAHLLWHNENGMRNKTIKTGKSTFEFQSAVFGKFVVSDLNGAVLQTYTPPKGQEISEFEWVDDIHWVAWLTGIENGYEQIQAKAMGDLSQPNVIQVVKTQPTEEYKKRYQVMRFSDIHMRVTPTLTVGEWNKMVSASDNAKSGSFLVAPPFENQRCIALSGDRKRLAWMTAHPMNAPLEKWYASFLTTPFRELRTRYNFWISDATGSNMRRVGGIDIEEGSDKPPSAVEWLPGDKIVCIRFQGKLWVIPVKSL